MPLIFGDDRAQFRKFDELMPSRSRAVSRGVLWRRGLASAATILREDEDVVDTIGRQELFQMRWMSRLPGRRNLTPPLFGIRALSILA